MATHVDVAIIGGGPAGSTTGSLLKKYNPNLKVLILEKEKFPREHVGESQLPLISAILNEMGVWDKVEAAGFPIKLGATYRWGASKDLWDFEFIPVGDFKDEPRPAKFAGQRVWTAFQVERAIYDKILLDHAKELGCDVREETLVREILRGEGDEADTVKKITLTGGEEIFAKHYVDASGNAAVLRRAMGVSTQTPTSLKNVAAWGYWDNAEWAVKIGVGGTRVFVLSIGCGWIWFIPIAPTRTSIGFVCPAEYYKKSGMSHEDLYHWALKQEPLVQKLTKNASLNGPIRATKDWSFLSDRLVGKNWFLVGETAGFADPILAGGLMITHSGARELAYTLLELERGEHDPAWLRERYETMNYRRMKQHIRFADFWYAGNGQFTDLEAYTAEIAKDAGLKLSPKQAFQWISNGGFLEDIPGRAGIGGLDLAATKKVTEMFLAEEGEAPKDIGWKISQFNVFHLNLKDATEEFMPILANGRITKAKCFRRENRTLPMLGYYAQFVALLQKTSAISEICNTLLAHYRKQGMDGPRANFELQQALQAFEVMLIDGWVWGQMDPSKGTLKIQDKKDGSMIHANSDPNVMDVTAAR